LGLTALSAITLVFFPLTGIAGRFTLSGAVAAILGVVCLPFVRWATRDDARWGGLAGIVFMCAEFALMLILVWGSLLVSGASGDEIAGTMLDLLLVAPTCIAGARTLGGRSHVAGVCALTCGLGALIFFLADTWMYGGFFSGFIFGAGTVTLGVSLRWYGLTLLITGSAAALGLVPSRSSWTRWPLIAVLLAIVAGGVSATIISRDIQLLVKGPFSSDIVALSKTATTCVLAAFAIGGANLLLLPKLDARGRLAQLAGVGFVALSASLAIVWMWTEDDQWGAAFGASCIALVCGVVGVAIIARFTRQPVLVSDKAILSKLELVCPRCQSRGMVPLGASSCASCGLRFRIDVEEPRCAGCGYLLVGARSDRCPECGLAVASPIAAPAAV